MKTYAMIRQFLTAASLAVVLSLLGHRASAQTAAPAAQQPTKSADPGDARIDLQTRPEQLGTVVDYIRERIPKANIVLGPGVSNTMVSELNLHSVDLGSIMQALMVATDFRLDCRPIPGGWAVRLPGRPSERQVEAFNLSGYLQQLGSNDDKAVNAGVEQIERIVLETVDALMKGRSKPEDMPGFRFHRGANLLVVVGPPEAIDVARKIVGALPGQSQPVGAQGQVNPLALPERRLPFRRAPAPAAGPETTPGAPPGSPPER